MFYFFGNKTSKIYCRTFALSNFHIVARKRNRYTKQKKEKGKTKY